MLNEPLEVMVLFDKYQTISGVQFPMRLTSYIEEEKVLEVVIEHMEFLQRIDDSLFARPPGN